MRHLPLTPCCQLAGISSPKTTRISAWLVGVAIVVLVLQMEANPMHAFKNFEMLRIYNDGFSTSAAKFSLLGQGAPQKGRVALD